MNGFYVALVYLTRFFTSAGSSVVVIDTEGICNFGISITSSPLLLLDILREKDEELDEEEDLDEEDFEKLDDPPKSILGNPLPPPPVIVSSAYIGDTAILGIP